MQVFHTGEVVGDDVEHGIEGLGLAVGADERLHAQETCKLILGHGDFGSLIFHHEDVIGAIEATFLEELTNEEPTEVFRREVSILLRCRRHIDSILNLDFKI